mgnify:CR=1 FL=1
MDMILVEGRSWKSSNGLHLQTHRDSAPDCAQSVDVGIERPGGTPFLQWLLTLSLRVGLDGKVSFHQQQQYGVVPTSLSVSSV